jgi:hypothetical protein
MVHIAARRSDRARPITGTVFVLLALVLAIVALAQRSWFTCTAGKGTFALSFGLFVWRSTPDGLSGSNCLGVGGIDGSNTVCIAGKVAAGLGIAGIVLIAVALLLLVLMAVWKRPSAMHSAAQVCSILGGILLAVAGISYVVMVSGDLQLSNVSLCHVEAAPVALLAVAAVLVFVSSCVMCSCCTCNCSDDLNTGATTTTATAGIQLQHEGLNAYTPASHYIPPRSSSNSALHGVLALVCCTIVVMSSLQIVEAAGV